MLRLAFMLHLASVLLFVSAAVLIPALPVLAQKELRLKKPSESAVQIKSGYADIGKGTHLYYETAGTGPVVILLHAHSLDRRMWDPQFLELAGHYRVIRYDLRGYGLSDAPIEGRQFTHADDLYQLMRVLRIPKAHLVGLSLGALVATDFLALHPESVLSMTVAAGAIHDVPPAVPETSEQRRAREETERQDRNRAIQKVNREGLDTYKQQWLTALLAICGPNRGEIRPKVAEMIQSWPGWQVTHMEADVLLETPVAPQIAALKRPVPVLVLIGRHDSEGSKHSSDALLHTLPRAHGFYLENAGHLSSMEAPSAFNHALETFLASQPR